MSTFATHKQLARLFRMAASRQLSASELTEMAALAGTNRFTSAIAQRIIARTYEFSFGDLGENEYLVHVTYAPLPSFAELETEFGKGNVSDIFDGRPFKKHDSCVGMDETPGNRIFWVAEVPADIRNDSEKIIAWGDKQRNKKAPNGYRPATEKELYEFQKVRFIAWLVSLGSSALSGGDRCVALLLSDSDGRIFGGWLDGGWDSDLRFLFVRK